MKWILILRTFLWCKYLFAYGYWCHLVRLIYTQSIIIRFFRGLSQRQAVLKNRLYIYQSVKFKLSICQTIKMRLRICQITLKLCNCHLSVWYQIHNLIVTVWQIHNTTVTVFERRPVIKTSNIKAYFTKTRLNLLYLWLLIFCYFQFTWKETENSWD